mmetsp:Transcript_10040/g.11216  ORF Transcript_10040/g.11216 Transcript_10040/m.11216 type:complete len:114 (-) Transcript_10040:37-378(-)
MASLHKHNSQMESVWPKCRGTYYTVGHAERHRETQRGTERHRERERSQRDTEARRHGCKHKVLANCQEELCASAQTWQASSVPLSNYKVKANWGGNLDGNCLCVAGQFISQVE